MPGEKIVDKELAEVLGVSRTPIREALQILEMQGFVEMRPGKETRVTTLCYEDIFRLYPPLAALESTAAEMVADHIDLDTIEQLYEINTQFQQAVTQKNKGEAIKYDEQFHQLIVDSADNPYITEFTSILQLHIKRFKYIFFQPSIIPAQASIEEHLSIIQAFKDQDKERAAKIMRQNWLRPMHIVAEHLKKTK